jgi:hypothetical protein
MVSGTLTVYLAGTTTPTDTWQDQALTTLNTNPVVLDARGECVLWLDSTKSYKFVLKNAGGVTQWTQDNISGAGALADILRTDLAASSGASLVGGLPYYSGNFTYEVPNGAPTRAFSNNIVTIPENLRAGTIARFEDVRYTGKIATGNSITKTKLSKWSNMIGGFGWNTWDVVISPLSLGSGYPTSPTDAQNFNIVIAEWNPVNRHSVTAIKYERRTFLKPVAGPQIVPETQDFTGDLNPNERRGFNAAWATALSKSPYTDTSTDNHAKFTLGFLTDPNAIDPGGYANFATGYRHYLKTVAIAAAGTGYVVGDKLTLSSGYVSSYHNEAVVTVLTVGGAGEITGIQLRSSGDYQDLPVSPLGVTGGTGAGAQISFTLSSTTSDIPHAFAGISGRWNHAIDTAVANVSLFATFVRSLFHVVAGTKIFTARNAANTTTYDVMNLNSSDQLTIMSTLTISNGLLFKAITARETLPTTAQTSENSIWYDTTAKSLAIRNNTRTANLHGTERETLENRPAAASTNVGKMFIKNGGSGVADILQIVMKKADGTYDWVDIS